MSRTRADPAPEVLRPLAAVLFLMIAFAHFTTLPEGFLIAPYVGVSLVLGFGMAVWGMLALCVTGRGAVWWFGLAEGLLNALGWMATRLAGLPVTDVRTDGDWLDVRGLALVFSGTFLAGLSAWVLCARRAAAREPVTSARDRVLNGR